VSFDYESHDHIQSMPVPMLIRKYDVVNPNRPAIALLCAVCVLFCWVSAFAQDEPRSAPDQDQGPQLFSANCEYCHGADGKGGRGPAIATLPKVIAMSNQDLIGIVHKGEVNQGMPGFPDLSDEGTKAVVRYLRTLQGVNPDGPLAKLAGNPDAGRKIFFGKGQCSTCHMVLGKGGFIAAELTTYASNRTADEIKRAIVDPDANLEPTSRVVQVRTKDGKSLTGVVRSEDNLNITLQTEDGRYHFLSRSSLVAVNYTEHSLMPRDYGTRLTPGELDDLAAFLIVTGRNAPAEPEAKSRHHDDD
jgi:cytochrome c oxidase cbb3-type subunit 3